MDISSSKSNSGSIVRAGIIELLISTVLVIGILATLNYFNIISISNFLPSLTFLPKQKVLKNVELIENNNERALGSTEINLQQIVKANQPKEILNSSSEYKHEYINGSSAKFNATARIDLEMSAKNTKVSSSGIIFDNGKKGQEHKEIAIFRNESGKSWVLKDGTSSEAKYISIKTAATAEEFQKFILLISQEGNSLIIVAPGQKPKTVELSDSLYTNGNKINTVAQIAPGAQLTIYSLYYQF